MLLRHSSKNSNAHLSPVGFSLIEVLIVLALLATLVALLANPISGLLGNAKEAATRTTIEQLDRIIQARHNAVLEADVSVEANKIAQLNSGVSKEEAEFLIRKILYRQALPQRPEDLWGMDMNAGNAADNAPMWADYLSAGGANASDGDGTTGAEVFAFAIVHGSSVRAIPGGKSYPVPVISVDDFHPDSFGDFDDDGLSEFWDGWGFPFRFYNFPTRLFRDTGTGFNLASARLLAPGLPTDTSTGGPLTKDPLDPGDLLRREFNGQDTSFRVGAGGAVTRAAFNEANYHTFSTHYIPFLVSIGPDSVSFGAAGLGLGEPTAASPDRYALIIDQDSGTGGIQITSPSLGETPIGDNITNLQ